MDFKTSIVIPVYKNAGLLHNLLSGLLKHEKGNVDEVVLLDDASPNDDELDETIWVWSMQTEIPVRCVTNAENVGFVISANRLLMGAYRGAGDRRSVFLISSDVSINGKFIQQANDILFGARRALVGNKLLFGDTGWNTFDGKIFEYLEGWFLGATSDGWRDLGYLDPAYAPWDYEDIDLSTTAKSKGYKLVPLNNPTLVHRGGGSIGYSKEREAITNRNREYFRKKWIK